jgi:hypothetical protein
VSNRAALKAAMPAIFAHEGRWDGVYRHISTDGDLIDQHRTVTWCELPDSGPWVYVQHNQLFWDDGREANYEFGGRLEGDLLFWDTDRFSGYGWQGEEETIMLKLDRLDVPGAYYVEMINIAPDHQARARTWQWFKDGKPWKRTLCDEWRIE